MMQLYYVRADDDNGENADCYAWATSPEGAASFVRHYWKELSGWDGAALWVDLVPSTPPAKPGVVPWEDVDRFE